MSFSDKTVSDTQLSAFIDGELNSQEMEHIRQLISQDETLADRLAQIASVDMVVNKTLHAIDQKPLPEATQRLLDSASPDLMSSPKISSNTSSNASSNISSNIVAFPLWRTVKQGVQRYAAVAAVLMLAVGFSFGQYFSADKTTSQWQQVSSALNQTPSGESVAINAEWDLTTKVSFKNQQGEYCRLFGLSSTQNSHQSIACKDHQGWQLRSRLPATPQQSQQYQTATVDPMTDQLIDSMIDGSFLSRSDETQAIEHNWQER